MTRGDNRSGSILHERFQPNQWPFIVLKIRVQSTVNRKSEFVIWLDEKDAPIFSNQPFGFNEPKKTVLNSGH